MLYFYSFYTFTQLKTESNTRYACILQSTCTDICQGKSMSTDAGRTALQKARCFNHIHFPLFLIRTIYNKANIRQKKINQNKNSLGKDTFVKCLLKIPTNGLVLLLSFSKWLYSCCENTMKNDIFHTAAKKLNQNTAPKKAKTQK